MEPTGSVLGTPFFLMDRIEGVIPQDVLPYNFGDNWLHDASQADQRRLQDGAVATVAALHAIPDAATTFAFLDKQSLDPDRSDETPLARNLARTRAWYDFAVTDIGRSPLAERGLAWLEAHLAEAEAEGAARPSCAGAMRASATRSTRTSPRSPSSTGRWRPSAPASSTCRGWSSPTRSSSRSPVSSSCRGCRTSCASRTSSRPTRRSPGSSVGDLTWFHVYNAVQWCVVFMRTGARSIHFGEIERPDDIETLMHHKGLMESILDGAGATA